MMQQQTMSKMMNWQMFNQNKTYSNEDELISSLQKQDDKHQNKTVSI